MSVCSHALADRSASDTVGTLTLCPTKFHWMLILGFAKGNPHKRQYFYTLGTTLFVQNILYRRWFIKITSIDRVCATDHWNQLLQYGAWDHAVFYLRWCTGYRLKLLRKEDDNTGYVITMRWKLIPNTQNRLEYPSIAYWGSPSSNKIPASLRTNVDTLWRIVDGELEYLFMLSPESTDAPLPEVCLC